MLWEFYRARISIAVTDLFRDLFTHLVTAGAYKGWWAVPTLHGFQNGVSGEGGVDSLFINRFQRLLYESIDF